MAENYQKIGNHTLGKYPSMTRLLEYT